MNKINFKPLGGDVVFKIDIVESIIALTEEQQKQKMLDDQNTVEIVAVGSNVLDISVGDKVLLRSPRYMSIAIDGQEYGQISKGEVLGIVLNDADTAFTKSMQDRLAASRITAPDGSYGGDFRIK